MLLLSILSACLHKPPAPASTSPRDEELAAAYQDVLRESCLAGATTACLLLADRLEHGPVAPNPAQAKALTNRGCAAGNEAACQRASTASDSTLSAKPPRGDDLQIVLTNDKRIRIAGLSGASSLQGGESEVLWVPCSEPCVAPEDFNWVRFEEALLEIKAAHRHHRTAFLVVQSHVRADVVVRAMGGLQGTDPLEGELFPSVVLAGGSW